MLRQVVLGLTLSFFVLTQSPLAVYGLAKRTAVRPYEDKSLSQRRHFRTQLAKVKEGMTPGDVLALLGAPDKKRSYDPYDKSVAWGYGIDKPGTLATFGTVIFTRKGTVFRVVGTKDPRFHREDSDNSPLLPPQNIITEAELRNMLSIFERFRINKPNLSESLYAESFDPLTFIKAANALLPYGKEKILLAAQEYGLICVEYGKPRNFCDILLLALFDIPSPQGHLPRFQSFVNMRGPFDSQDKNRIPRFPLLLIEDVPILLPYRGSEGIYAAPPVYERPELEYLKKYCKLRKRPLTPSKNPFALVDHLSKNPRWLYDATYKSETWQPEYTKREQIVMLEFVRFQILRLVRSAIPHPHRTNPTIRQEYLSDAEWRKYRREFFNTRSVWDAKNNEYRRLAGNGEKQAAVQKKKMQFH